MKKTLYLVFLLFSILCSAQEYYMENPEGYGSATVGGGDRTPITVNSYTGLLTAIRSSAPEVILVSGDITIPSGGRISETVRNKSIIGLPGAKLINTNQNSGAGILYLRNGSDNVIIRNLTFIGPGAYDIDGQDNLTADGCTNLWVDHCEFQDGQDGNFDIKGRSDNVTVSWCKFVYLKPPKAGGSGGSNDHRFTNLVGSGKSDAPADGHFSVTFQNNYWGNGCRERMPRARNAELHILNCYYNTDVSSSTALGLGGGNNNLSCYVENSHFARVGTVFKSYISSDGGTVDLVFDDCINGVNDRGTVNKPNYAYNAFPVSDVEKYIANADCGAGATLEVSAQGELSSSCGSLGISKYSRASEKPIRFYSNSVEQTIMLDFFKIGGTTSIKVYAINGQEVIQKTTRTAIGEKLSVDISALSKGIYVCKLQVADTPLTWKFVKN